MKKSMILVCFLIGCGDNGAPINTDGSVSFDTVPIESDSKPHVDPTERDVYINIFNFSQTVEVNETEPIWEAYNGSLIARLKTPDETQNIMGTGVNYVEYDIKLPSSGQYYLYFRARSATQADGELGGIGTNDSFFIPANFGEKPNVLMDGWNGNFTGSAGDSLTTELAWYRSNHTYVASDTLVSFSIGTRQDGLIINSIMFSKKPCVEGVLCN